MNLLRHRIVPFATVAVVTLILAGCARTMENPDADSAGMACNAERGTPRAPEEIRSLSNPLEFTPETIATGRRLYQQDAEPIACAQCHGVRGDGMGPLARHLSPAPSNFTCDFYAAVSDGQLFWVIRDGSGVVQSEPGHSRAEVRRPGRRDRETAMRAHGGFLTETEIWQIVAYLRTFQSAED